jgi:hypothetical protein
MLTLVWGALGCQQSVDCDAPGALLVPGEPGSSLSCTDALDAVEYVEVLAGRKLADGDDRIALSAIADRFRARPDETRTWLGEIRRAGGDLERAEGLEGAEQRSREVYLASAGRGMIREDAGELWSVQSRALAVWAKDDAEQLAVTESDLEGWLHFASLCREVQGGGALRASVADRVSVYRTLIDRFQSGDRAAKIALGSLGPVWPQVKVRWQMATYEQQQAFIQRAPLPPPMTATSLGYADTLYRGDVAGLTSALFTTIGPLRTGGLLTRFGGEVDAEGAPVAEPGQAPAEPSPAPAEATP